MSKTITAVFGNGIFTTTARVFQWDVGDKLQFVGIDLPDGYRVDFSNSLTGTSKPVLGDSSGVVIPAEFFQPGEMIYAWVVIPDSEGKYTKYQVNIPIYARAEPTDQEPTPEQQSALDGAISALNDAQGTLEEATRQLAESGITPEEREKLAGIEAGAEVNVIEEVRTYDPFRHEYVPLPITGKGVDLPEINIPTEVFYPAFTVEDDGDNLVVTSASHTPPQILNEAMRNDEAIIAVVSFRGRDYYLPLAEAQDNQAPYTCSFAGVIDDLKFLRIFGTGDSSWTAREYLAPDANWLENELEALRNAIPETAGDVGAVAVEQGTSHAGEFLVVGSDGSVTTKTMSAWQGGSY